MKRLIANFFAGLYLILFIISAFMWVRGYFVADNLRHQSRQGFYGAISSQGDLCVFSYDWSAFKHNAQEGWHFQSGGPINVPEYEMGRAAIHRHFAGFWFFRDTRLPQLPGTKLPGWCIVIPYWFLAVTFVLVPLGRLLRLKARGPRRRVAPAA